MGWRSDSIASCKAHYPQASEGFSKLASATTLSFAVGWKGCIQRGRRFIYPNLCGVLLGESSITMKSSVINFYKDILKHAAGDFKLQSPAGTESFEKALAAHRAKFDQGWWYNPEIGGLFATMGQPYGQGIGDDLTLLWDLEEIHRNYSDSKKSIHIEPIFASALWGVTPAVVMDYLKPIHATQGFLQRPAVIFGRPSPFVPMPSVTANMTTDYEIMRDAFHNGFLLIANSSPVKLTLHPDAQTLLDLWEADLNDRVRSGKLNGAGAKRGIEIALKLAIINKFDRLRPPKTPIVTMNEMDKAIKEADTYIVGANELRGLLADEPDFAKVRNYVRTRGTTDECSVMNSCNVEDKRMKEIVNSLTKRKLIDRVGFVYTWIGG